MHSPLLLLALLLPLSTAAPPRTADADGYYRAVCRGNLHAYTSGPRTAPLGCISRSGQLTSLSHCGDFLVWRQARGGRFVHGIWDISPDKVRAPQTYCRVGAGGALECGVKRDPGESRLTWAEGALGALVGEAEVWAWRAESRMWLSGDVALTPVQGGDVVVRCFPEAVGVPDIVWEGWAQWVD